MIVEAFAARFMNIDVLLIGMGNIVVVLDVVWYSCIVAVVAA